MLRAKVVGVILVAFVASMAGRGAAWAQAGDAADLAKQLSNPVASLISVPFQFNYDARIGPEREGDRFYLNFQPVIPIPLDKDWNLISRTILPLTSIPPSYSRSSPIRPRMPGPSR